MLLVATSTQWLRAARDAPVGGPVRRPHDRKMAQQPWGVPENFNPGYLSRSLSLLPRQGTHARWLHSQDYATEQDELPVADLDDGTLAYR